MTAAFAAAAASRAPDSRLFLLLTNLGDAAGFLNCATSAVLGNATRVADASDATRPLAGGIRIMADSRVQVALPTAVAVLRDATPAGAKAAWSQVRAAGAASGAAVGPPHSLCKNAL